MKRIIRILTVTLSLAIISASLNGCDIRKDVTSTLSELGAAEKKTGIDKIGYTLPYLRTDSLNPYKAQSGTNLALSVLLFDSLFKVDDAFKAQPLIAESYSQNSTILSVTLKNGLKFSDGTAVTAKDVIYSFNAAKESENYAVNLKNMSEASAQSGTKVNFSLYKQNQFEVNNLTFPVIKAGSDIDDKSSDDYSANVPVGSGRYTIVSGSEGKYLAANKSRLGEYLPEYNMIGLKDSTDESSLYNMFSLGEIDLYTENFSQENIPELKEKRLTPTLQTSHFWA